MTLLSEQTATAVNKEQVGGLSGDQLAGSDGADSHQPSYLLDGAHNPHAMEVGEDLEPALSDLDKKILFSCIQTSP